MYIHKFHFCIVHSQHPVLHSIHSIHLHIIHLQRPLLFNYNVHQVSHLQCSPCNYNVPHSNTMFLTFPSATLPIQRQCSLPCYNVPNSITIFPTQLKCSPSSYNVSHSITIFTTNVSHPATMFPMFPIHART
jgi:hypothetical protein